MTAVGYPISTGWGVWWSVPAMVVWLSMAIGFMMFINAVQVPRLQKIMAESSTRVLDMRFFYSPAVAYGVLERIGPQAREAYRRFLVRFDFAFPFIYSIALISALTVVLRPLASESLLMQDLRWLPACAGVLDWWENLAILHMLQRFPSRDDRVARFAGFFTAGKWITVSLTLVLLLSALVVRGIYSL